MNAAASVDRKTRFYPVQHPVTPAAISWEELGALSADLVWCVDARQGTVLYVNSECERVLGHAAAELIGKAVADTVIGEDQDSVLDLLASDYSSSGTTGGVAAVTLRRKHKPTGKAIALDSRWRCQVGSDGHPERHVVVERELGSGGDTGAANIDGAPCGASQSAAQERRAGALAQACDRCGDAPRVPSAGVLDGCSDIVMCMDAEAGTILSVSAACYNTLGFKPADMVGHNYYDFMEMASHEKVMKQMAGLKEPGQSLLVEFKRRHRGGKMVIVECAASLAPSGCCGSEPQRRCIVCVERDVTHRWRQMYGAELKRQTREAEARMGAAQLEEARMTMLATRNCDYLFKISPEAAALDVGAPTGIVTAVSPRTATVLGVPAEDIIGRSDMHLIAQEQVVQVNEARGALFAKMRETGGNAGAGELRHTYTRNCSSGRTITVEASYFGLFAAPPQQQSSAAGAASGGSAAAPPALQKVLVMERDVTEAMAREDEGGGGGGEDGGSGKKKKRSKPKGRQRRISSKDGPSAGAAAAAAFPMDIVRAPVLERRRPFLVRFLGLNNDDVNASTDCVVPELRYPLVVAAAQNNAFRMSLLLALGADCNIIPPEVGFGALHMAVMSNSMECLALLVASGADLNILAHIDDETATPLAIAAKEGYTDLVKALLEMGADASCRDQDGNTPLHYAVELDHAQIARALLQHGADVMAANAEGFTPATLVERLGATECAEAVREVARRISDACAADLLALNSQPR